MEDMALAVFRRGHLPVLGEWFALPLLKHAGSKAITTWHALELER